jgi:class 3 adenylate cyclase
MTKSAEGSHNIVENLFPAVVRDRLFRSNEDKKGGRFEQWERGDTSSFATKRSSIANGSPSPPIADHFTDTTVLFADIAGFTAWSSEREPAQVFQLLETLFQEFDIESKKLGIFKVETVGDCYGKNLSLPHHSRFLVCL